MWAFEAVAGQEIGLQLYPLWLSIQCTVTPRNPLIFRSDQMSTVTETWSVLLSWVFNFERLSATRFSVFDVNVLRHTGLYLLSSTVRKCRKLLFSTIDGQAAINNQVGQYCVGDCLLLWMAYTVMPYMNVQELGDCRLLWFIGDAFGCLAFFISLRCKQAINGCRKIPYSHTWITF